MGEVWRARDTRLNRDVALKFLPAAFAQDRERLVRFEREAQMLAQADRRRERTSVAVAGSSGYPGSMAEATKVQVPETGEADPQLVEAIDEGLAQLQAGRGVPAEEVDRLVEQWDSE